MLCSWCHDRVAAAQHRQQFTHWLHMEGFSNQFQDHACRIQQTDWHNNLPHEAPHMLKVAYECLAEVHILCSRHIFSRVVSVVVIDIKNIKHVKHKARMPFRHVANAILEHLHMRGLKLFAQAKATKDLSEL